MPFDSGPPPPDSPGALSRRNAQTGAPGLRRGPLRLRSRPCARSLPVPLTGDIPDSSPGCGRGVSPPIRSTGRSEEPPAAPCARRWSPISMDLRNAAPGGLPASALFPLQQRVQLLAYLLRVEALVPRGVMDRLRPVRLAPDALLPEELLDLPAHVGILAQDIPEEHLRPDRPFPRHFRFPPLL